MDQQKRLYKPYSACQSNFADLLTSGFRADLIILISYLQDSTNKLLDSKKGLTAPSGQIENPT